MTGASMGRQRRRVYKRAFDWAEARARHAAGESMYSLAKVYGVNRTAIQRVIRMPAHLVDAATDEQMERLGDFSRDQQPCPRCDRPMAKGSQLCRDCFNETRLKARLRIEKDPGQKRVVLADVEPGRIVRVAGRWGVVVQGGSKDKSRLVDFWDGGREYVSDISIVETAIASRVFLDDVEEQAEEIAA